MPTVIHVSPHPDDESIGAPCTLLALQEAGWEVVNLACSLGRPEAQERRRGELLAAMKVAGFTPEIPPEPLLISRHDDLEAATERLVGIVRGLVARTGATLVVGPHPRDGHHGHLAVARAIRQVVWRSRPRITWWMWSIWADLPHPTLVVDCHERELLRSEEMLRCYRGENGRNDYLAMHRQIREVNVIRGVEKAFGFGSGRPAAVAGIEHAELLTEVTRIERHWMVGEPRVLDPQDPLPGRWHRLDDMSIMSTTRLRRLYAQPILTASATVRRVRERILPGRPR